MKRLVTVRSGGTMLAVVRGTKGRVFHSPLSHDVAAFHLDDVGELVRRGTAWTARIEPVAK